jgi:hypothetical protein
MRENLRHFGRVAPDPAEFHVQGRPRLITPDAREAVLDFLLENGKMAYVDEVRFLLEDEWDIKASWETVRSVIKSLEMTEKVVGCPSSCSELCLSTFRFVGRATNATKR